MVKKNVKVSSAFANSVVKSVGQDTSGLCESQHRFPRRADFRRRDAHAIGDRLTRAEAQWISIFG
jgi:hypothetical protein